MKRLLILFSFTLLFSFLYAQWSNDATVNTPISVESGEQAIPKIGVTQNNKVFIGYFSLENGNYDVRLQLLDETGIPIWDENGILVSNHPQMTWLTDWDMKVDNNGNAILAFQDIRSNGNNNIVAYSVSQSGEFLWGDDGIMLSDNGMFSAAPKIGVTSAGNVIVAWQEDDRITIQKISPQGDLLFANGGIILQESNLTLSWPQIIPEDNDNFILKYFKDSEPAWAPVRKIYAMKYDENGNAVWNTETAISSAGGISAWTQILPIVKDDNGGFYIAWYEDRDADNLSEIYIQHVDSTGNITFAQNGIEFCTNTVNNHFYPELQFYQNYVVAVWSEMDGNQNQRGIYAQKISTNGDLLWGNDGKILVPLTNTDTGLIALKKIENDFVVFYYLASVEMNDHLYASRYDTDGEPVWENVEVSNADGEKLHFDTSNLFNDQFVMTWEDRRNGNDSDIYAQNINSDGTLGSDTIVVVLEDVNVQITNDNILISWSVLDNENLSGWNLYRNTEINFETASLINQEMIPANQTDYSYLDQYDFVDGETYYYWIEAVDNSGVTSIFGPFNIEYSSVSANNDILSFVKSGLKNYPNPFNPTTTISYTLPINSKVILNIYNLKGELIKNIKSGYQKAGSYNVVWNGKDKTGKTVASGVYFYKLVIDGKSAISKKCLLMK